MQYARQAPQPLVAVLAGSRSQDNTLVEYHRIRR